jgi:hypothetical protein
MPTHKIQLRHPVLGWRDYLPLAPRTTAPSGPTADEARELLASCIPAGWPPARVVPIGTPADWALPDSQ